jgi:hypothetical protein
VTVADVRIGADIDGFNLFYGGRSFHPGNPE